MAAMASSTSHSVQYVCIYNIFVICVLKLTRHRFVAAHVKKKKTLRKLARVDRQREEKTGEKYSGDDDSCTNENDKTEQKAAYDRHSAAVATADQKIQFI